VAPQGKLPIDVLDGLMALVDRSLIRPSVHSPVNEPRFEMLQLIREYGAERLADTDEAADVGWRHAEWGLALAEAAAPVLEGAMDVTWFDRLTLEHDNLRAALRWLIDHGERETGLRLASAMWRFWQQRGHIREGRQWFDSLLPAEDEEGALDPETLGAAHTAAGGLAYWQNALDDAEAHYQLALEIDRRHDRADRLGDDVYNLAFVAMARTDLETARRRFLQSADLFTAAGQSARLADTTAARGALEMRAGNLEEARDLLEDGRRLNLEYGNRRRATDNAMVLSSIYFRLGKVDTARERLLTTLADTIDMGDVTRWPLMLDIGVLIFRTAQRPRDALHLAGAAAKRRANMGGGPPAFVVGNVAQIIAEARAALIEQDGPDAADKAFAEGELLDDDALAALLRDADSPGRSVPGQS
jgi:non-specific serine/threonine protein kinase